VTTRLLTRQDESDTLYPMKPNVKGSPTSIRLTAESVKILRGLRRRYGMTRAAAIEFALRRLDESIGGKSHGKNLRADG